MRDAHKRWPWFVPVFAAYPPLHIASSNPGQAENLLIASVVGVALLCALALLMALRLIFRSWAVGGLAAAWIIVLFFAYGPINEWWVDFATARIAQRGARIAWFYGNPQAAQSLVWILLVVAGTTALRRTVAQAPTRAIGGLNVMAVVLTVLLVFRTILNATDGAEIDKPAKVSAVASAIVNAPAPDIYLIALDGYARADILAKHYGFENDSFIDGLRQRGFQVSDASRSNFSWTFLSLGSTLNLDYVQALLGDGLDPASRNRKEIYRILRDNRAAQFLTERGYRTVQLQSTWGGTGSNPYVDQFLPCNSGIFGHEYVRAIADASWIRALESKASMDIATCHLRNFETLAAQAGQPGPKFVFAHFLPPHHPYLFDRDGRVLRRATLSDQFEFQKRLWEDRDSYIDQLIYVNHRIKVVIDRLLTHSPHLPIIILMSDHGPNLRDRLGQIEQRNIRLANFTAMFLPDAPANLLPDEATPVNHLRRIFNHYFDAGLPLLPDRYFVSSYDFPFELTEVDANGHTVSPTGGF
jgi:hypothetical protein